MVLRGVDVVRYEVRDAIATITLNRPERRNAMSVELLDRLDEVWRQFDADDSTRVAVLTGAGDRAFCSGGDLKDFTELGIQNVAEARGGVAARYPSAGYGWEVSKPVIAAVNGYALAGGFMLALNADIRIASANAEFGVTEAVVGRAAPWAIPMLWAMPSSVALEMLFTGGRLGAERAREIGFVNEVVDSERLLERAHELAAVICANAQLTVRAHKRMYYRAMDVGRAAGYLIADDLCREVYASEDCQEGQRAFKEGRPPRFVGR